MPHMSVTRPAVHSMPTQLSAQGSESGRQLASVLAPLEKELLKASSSPASKLMPALRLLGDGGGEGTGAGGLGEGEGEATGAGGLGEAAAW